jgi:hypothetical protein
MTEAEAGKRVCPFNVSVSWVQFQPRGTCIGSLCMMWRWDKSDPWPPAHHTGEARSGDCSLKQSFP